MRIPYAEIHDTIPVLARKTDPGIKKGLELLPILRTNSRWKLGVD
jgi:hypothetical protein